MRTSSQVVLHRAADGSSPADRTHPPRDSGADEEQASPRLSVREMIEPSVVDARVDIPAHMVPVRAAGRRTIVRHANSRIIAVQSMTAIIPRLSGGTKKSRRNCRREKHSQHFSHVPVSSPCSDADVLMTKLRAFVLVAKKGQRVHKGEVGGVGRAGRPPSSPLLVLFPPRPLIGGEAVPFRTSDTRSSTRKSAIASRQSVNGLPEMSRHFSCLPEHG
jgi:hypothetical protein